MISSVWIKDFEIFYFSNELNSCEEIAKFFSLIIFIVGEIERSFLLSYSGEVTSTVDFLDDSFVIRVELVRVLEATEEHVIER